MRHLFSHTTPRELGMLRAAVFGAWLVIILFSPLSSYASLPRELFEPLGIFRLFFRNTEGVFLQWMLSRTFLVFLKFTLLAGCFLCMIGTKGYRWIVAPTVLLLFLADGITKGFNGFVNHAELGILYTSFILALFPSADGFTFFKKKGSSYPKKKENYTIPVLITAFTICLAYTFIGVHRLLYGGFDQFFNHALEIHLIKNSLNYAKYSFDFGLVIVSSKYLVILFKTGFFAVTMFELFSLFILINKPFRILWLYVMIPFHVLSLLTMNIFFWENLVLIGILFLVVPYAGDIFRKTFSERRAPSATQKRDSLRMRGGDWFR